MGALRNSGLRQSWKRSLTPRQGGHECEARNWEKDTSRLGAAVSPPVCGVKEGAENSHPGASVSWELEADSFSVVSTLLNKTPNLSVTSRG